MVDVSWERAVALLARSISGEPVPVHELDAVRADLIEGVSSERPPAVEASAAKDPRLILALDLMAAMSLLEDDDPALPWNRAALLAEADLYVEAAQEALEAARRCGVELDKGAPSQRDEEQMMETALYLGCKYFIKGGRPFTASIVLRQIQDDEYKDELRESLKAEALHLPGPTL